MEKKYLLGLDLGTTNIKVVLVSYDGKVKKAISKRVLYNHGPNGEVECDAQKFYMGVMQVIKELSAVVESADQITAISMVSASGNTVLLDENNDPIRPVINWRDKRFTDEMETVLQNPDMQELYETAGWPFYKSFPLAHLSWLKLNETENLKSAKRVCLITDYINLRLTNKFKTNPSTATTTYLLNQKAAKWASPIIVKLGISSKMLPEIIKSGKKIGVLSKEAAQLSGLLHGTPVIAGAFDHPGSARGMGVLHEGDLLLSCGTSWVGFYPFKNREKLVSMEMLIDPFLSDGGCWAGMFSLPSIGKHIDTLIMKWISDKEI